MGYTVRVSVGDLDGDEFLHHNKFIWQNRVDGGIRQETHSCLPDAVYVEA
jgi:hypothetical protein